MQNSYNPKTTQQEKLNKYLASLNLSPLEMNLPETQKTYPKYLPMKFWDKEKSEVRLEPLLKSYRVIERKYLNLLTKYNRLNSLNEKNEALANENVSDNFIEEFANRRGIDKEDIRQAVKELRMTEKQLQQIDTWWQKFQGDIPFSKEDYMPQLTNFFGSVEMVNSIVPKVEKWTLANLPKDSAALFLNSAHGIIALYNLLEKIKEPSLSHIGMESVSVNDEESLRRLMRSPKYWRDRDPKIVAQVKEGFDKIYKDK